MSDFIKKAVIAAEDLHYYNHNGFDWESIKRANDKNKSGLMKTRYGGSTISQQTAKNVFLWQGGGWVRKGAESYFTALIELVWNKQRILEVYLNVIEMGDGIFGIEAASRNYFGKPAKLLTKREAALIAVCLPNPLKYNPANVELDVDLQNKYYRILARIDYVELKE